jgi:nucleotide-binding universal stress UspA family protein
VFFEKLLIAVDDSPPSQYAIDVGITAALEDGSSVIFGIALDPSLLARDYGFAAIAEMAERKAAGIAANAVQRATDRGVAASSQIFFEDPTQGIIELAKTQRVGMIVMGTHARTGLMRALNRSIAEEVLRKTATPLCVVRRPAIGKIYHRLLVPIVDDDLSKMTAQYATEVARAFGSRLLFCTVTNAGDAISHDKDFLELAKQRAGEAGIESESVIIPLEGSVSRCILKRVRAEECDAIVMASHARDGLKRLMEGSVAETVIRSSETPVIVLRAVTQRNGQPVIA